MTEAQAGKTPKHLWIVGIVTLLWNLMGAVDYVMTKMKIEAYMGQFTPEQLEFFYGLPTWLVAFWATAVWCSVAGSILLLLRKKFAFPVLLVSFVCMVVTTIHNYGFGGGADVSSSMDMLFSAVIFVVALGLVVYARSMAKKGVLV